METIKKTGPTFHLGVCMAGAISAGAYTAGVMDYLLEALTAYEKVRGTGDYPCHKIEIPVIGGASAGGMTAIITAAAVLQKTNHLNEPDSAAPLAERKDNLLYHSWVDLTNEDMFTQMLGNDDIEGSVASALNCSFINDVANRALTPDANNQPLWQELPEFFPNRLKLFTTLSNLEGFNYNVNFISGDNETERRPYYMTFHNDYGCFEIRRDQNGPTEKGWMRLDLKSGVNAGIAKQAAMATGAFPIGLKAQIVNRSRETVINNPLIDHRLLKDTVINDEVYESLNVDGGMINNEPFDKVRDLLIKAGGQKEKTAYQNFEKFNSTVIMVAPFPSTKPKAIFFSDKILNVLGLLLSAVISQMRFKPWEVRDANNKDCAGQFLIDPSRDFDMTDVNGVSKKIKLNGERAIACGALGGFSGFLNKEFRIHDFYLGRHNCKIFLKDYFTIPDKNKDENPIFREGYNGVQSDKYRGKDGGWQIIPIVDDVNYHFPKMGFQSGKDWPEQPWSAISKFDKPLRSRIEAIIMNIVQYTFCQRLLLWPGVHFFIRGMIAKSFLKTVRQELLTWRLTR